MNKTMVSKKKDTLKQCHIVNKKKKTCLEYTLTFVHVHKYITKPYLAVDAMGIASFGAYRTQEIHFNNNI